jgi:N-acetylmuramoyl-L-alanine amidase
MKTIFLASLLALLTGCASVPATPPAPTGPTIDRSLTAKSQSPRVKFIVLHYTVADLPRSIQILTQQVVSAHYLITDTPKPFIYQLVDETRQANQAGISSWKAYTNVNPMSIGIEIVNPGFKDTPEGRIYYPYPQAQMDVLIPLLKDIVQRYGIPPDSILGHSDVAPQRKIDPGPMFPWKQLADAGLITWPDAAAVAAQSAVYGQQLPDIAWFQNRLELFGYAVPHTGELDEATRNVIIAFQQKYRQSKFDGTPDPETGAILQVLTAPLLAAVQAPPPPAGPTMWPSGMDVKPNVPVVPGTLPPPPAHTE